MAGDIRKRHGRASIGPQDKQGEAEKENMVRASRTAKQGQQRRDSDSS